MRGGSSLYSPGGHRASTPSPCGDQGSRDPRRLHMVVVGDHLKIATNHALEAAWVLLRESEVLPWIEEGRDVCPERGNRSLMFSQLVVAQHGYVTLGPPLVLQSELAEGSPSPSGGLHDAEIGMHAVPPSICRPAKYGSTGRLRKGCHLGSNRTIGSSVCMRGFAGKGKEGSVDVFNIVVGSIGMLAAGAQIASLILQVRSTRGVAGVNNNLPVSSVSVINIRESIFPTQPSAPTRQAAQQSSSDDYSPWLWIVGLLVGGYAVASLYLEYRVGVLLSVAMIVLLCLAATSYTVIMVRRQKVVGRGLTASWYLILANFAVADALLIYLLLRTTPYGSYQDLLARIRQEGVAIFITDRVTIFFVLYELIALLYIVVVSVLLTLRQLGTLNLIMVVLHQRRANWTARFAPKRELTVWLAPLGMLAVLGLAVLLASPGFVGFILDQAKLPR